ncbi:MAG: hypothetical protein FWD98_09645, partial [Defluviitaleaceae bacterium]|nr:hypothetical protein [Defluviitaleaceae bacterium]
MNDVREDILAPDADGHAVFCGLAFDGCYIYATLPMGCKVRRFSPELRPRGVYKTTRPYRAIAYDTRGKFFWASSDGDIDKLYKLDRKLQEVDRLTLKIDKSDICSPIVSLSYDCERDKILVAYKDAVMEADKAGEVRVLRRQSMPRAEAVLAAAPYYAVALKGDSDTEIVITEMEGRHVFTLPVPDGYTVQDMALQPCSRDKDDTPDGVRHERHGTAQILVLVQKHGGYPAILRYKADCVKLACCNYDVCREKCGKHNDDDDG